MKNLTRKLGFIIIFLSLFSSAGLSQTTESITINTYYPTPYGQYRSVWLWPQGAPACREGLMYFDNATSSLRVCSSTAYPGPITVSAPAGAIAFYDCTLPIPAGWELFGDYAGRFIVGGQGAVRYVAPTTVATVPIEHHHGPATYSQADHSHSMALMNIPQTTNTVIVEDYNNNCSNGAWIPNPLWNDPFNVVYIPPCGEITAALATHTHTIPATNTNSDGGETIVGESSTDSHVPLYYSTCLIRKRAP